jgi:glycogen operon protein
MIKTKRGKTVLGSTVNSDGTNFAIFSRNATSITLELFKNFYDEKPFFSYSLDPIKNKTGDIWHVFVCDIRENTYYGWRADGPYEPENGHRYNKTKLLFDPYAKAISGIYDFKNKIMYGYDKDTDDDTTFSFLDSSECSTKSIVIDDSNYDWEDDVHPRMKLNDTIIYEMHVRLFTMNENSEVEHKGTFEGVIEKLEYLKELGVNCLELLPIFEFNSDANINVNPETGESLKDIWGYNPIGFFAVTGNYSYGMRLGEQVFQFKDFVKYLHKNGFEVILDVVYNHTGEGNEMGPTISFRGLDNSIYYLLEQHNKRLYCNYSGTGNTFNCSHTVVKDLVIESLRYWVTEMHVDGFRFDLAAILGRDSKGNWIGDLSLLKEIADDPILSGSKLIAEGWDAAGGYYVGEFPTGWAEWNGKYRDTVRRFIRGDKNTVADLATRISGSPDLFAKPGRNPYHSINFITAHDGFTMWDLVSFNEKNNFLNGENNKDGTNDNYSFNHGIEGETEDLSIIKLRKKQIKNMITILMISQGVPMFLMGDEFCNTQFGNNNAYCHDNEISWIDWSRLEKFEDVFLFFKKMINFRKEHTCLRRKHFFTGKDITGDGIADVTWHGVKPNCPDFSFNSHTLAFLINGEEYSNKNLTEKYDIYIALNSYNKPLDFEIPQIQNKDWYRIVDTSLDTPRDFLEVPEKIDKIYTVKEKSSIILISK